jgi:hypothetical protein
VGFWGCLGGVKAYRILLPAPTPQAAKGCRKGQIRFDQGAENGELGRSQVVVLYLNSTSQVSAAMTQRKAIQ